MTTLEDATRIAELSTEYETLSKGKPWFVRRALRKVCKNQVNAILADWKDYG